MMELVFWSFVVTLPPLVLSVGVRTLAILADVFAWYGARQVDFARHAEPTVHCVARGVRLPESCGHGA
jgi:hypothetical protein